MRKGFEKVKCLVCDDYFEKRVSEIKRYPNHCCSKKCRFGFNDKKIEKKCKTCGASIFRPPSLFYGKKFVFCNKECYDKFQSKRKKVVCDFCGSVFEKQLSIIKRSRNNFCSLECSGKYVCKTSFIELEFEKLIKDLGIFYIRNDRNIIGPKELDFYFPDYNYAVEINGKAHYEPIYGEEVLAAHKKRDSKKKMLCKEKGIILRVVKPGNCILGVYMRRLKRVAWELKRHVRQYN